MNLAPEFFTRPDPPFVPSEQSDVPSAESPELAPSNDTASFALPPAEPTEAIALTGEPSSDPLTMDVEGAEGEAIEGTAPVDEPTSAEAPSRAPAAAPSTLAGAFFALS